MPEFQPGNKEGTKRGPNKVSTKVREAIMDFLELNTPKIQGDFDKLKPRDRLKFISELISYAAPKLSSVQVDAEHKGGLLISFAEPEEYKRLYPTQDQGNIPDLDSDQ